MSGFINLRHGNPQSMKKHLLLASLMLPALSWAQCPPASPLSAPINLNFTGVTVPVVGTVAGASINPSCWILNSDATATGMRWETEDATGANENSLNTGPWFDNTTFGVAGGVYLYLETSAGVAGSFAYFTSPDIDLTGLTTQRLEFYYHMYGASMGSLEVEVFSGGVWSNVWSQVGQVQTAGSQPWNLAVVPLTSYSGVIKVRFKGIRGTSFEGDLAIDDIYIGNAPLCPQPFGLGVASTGSTTANIQWTAGDPTATAWEVEYGPTGFVQGAGTLVPTTAPNAALSSLMPGTSYAFYVRETCVSVSGQSNWSGPFPFRTAYGIPYLHDFSTATTAQPGTDWNEADGNLQNPTVFTSTSASTWLQDGFANNGTTGAYRIQKFSSTTLYTEWILSPSIDLGTGQTLEVRFDAAVTAAGGTGPGVLGVDDTIALVISTNNGATWERSNIIGLLTSANTFTNTGSKFAFPVTGYSGTVRFGLYAKSNASTTPSVDFFVDNFEVRVPPACPDPTGIGVSGITSTAANISWTSTGTNFNIEYGPSGFSQGTGTVLTSSTNSIALAGLTGNTTYDVYVQNDCGGNGVSVWSGPITFTTLCNTASMPYTRNFNTWPPACWDLTGGTQTVAQNANNYMFFNFWGWTSGNFALATTEPITIGQDAQVEFRWSHLYSSTYPLDQLLLQVSIAGSGNWVTIKDLIGITFTTPGAANTAPAPDANFIQELIYLDPATYTNQTVQFRFRGNSGFGPSVYVDDFKVTAIPSCPPPAGLSATAVLSSTATINWTSTGTAFNIEYGPAGFGQGTGTVVTSTSNSVNLTGLNGNTTYHVYVQNNCGTGTSSWAGPLSFTTLCNTASIPYNRDFNTWPPACWDLTGGTQTVAQNANNYMFFNFWGWTSGNFALATTEPIFIGQNAQIEFSWSHLYSTVYPLDQLLVQVSIAGSNNWVTVLDLIGPTFTTPGAANTAPAPAANFIPELIYLDPATYTNQTIQVRLRGNSGFGPNVYVNDFKVVPVPACPPPTQLDDVLLEGYQATVTWSGFGTNYNVEWGPQGFGQGSGTVIPTTNDTVTITGLTPVTCYDFYVQNNCGGTQSAWAGPFTFCTTVSCPAPTGVNITPTAFTATINYLSGAANTNYVWGLAGTTPTTGTVLSTNQNSINLTGLTAATVYTIWLQDSCGVGDVSTWAGPFNFATLCAPITAPYSTGFTGIAAGLIGTQPTPLTLSNCWEMGAGGTGLRWETEDATGANENSLATGPFFDNTTPATPGGMYVYLETSSGGTGNVAFFTSPEIVTTSLTNPELRFAYHMYGATMDTLRVDVWSNGVWDLNAWSIFGQQQTSGAAPWNTGVVNLASYGDTIRVRFAGRRGTSFTGDISLDDISIANPPACPSPQLLGAFNTTAFTSQVYWTTGAPTATTWYVEYGPAGFNPGSGTTVTASNDTVLLTGLMPATAYHFYVSELCANGIDTSNLVGPAAFATLCAPLMAPYTANFTGVAPGLIGTQPVPLTLTNCWELGADVGGLRWETEDASGANENSLATGPFFDATTPSTVGGMYLYLETSFGAAGARASVVSPEIVLTNLTVPYLTFAYHMYGATMDSLRVDVWSNGVWDVNAWSIFGQQQTAGSDPWLTAGLSLAAYSDTIRVRFVGRRGTSFTGDISLDDVKFDEAPACPAPTQPNVIGTTTNTATVYWTAGSPAATTWFVEYGAPGFTPGTGTVVSPASTNDTITISGLSASTTYEFYVSELCPNGIDTSNATGPRTFTTLCTTANMPYLRDMNTWPPTCWDLTGGTFQANHNSLSYMEFDFWGQTSGNYAVSTSEAIFLNQNAELRYKWSHLYSAIYPNDQLIVMVSIAGSGVWDTVSNLIGTTFTTPGAANTAPAPANNFIEEVIALDPATYTGQSIQVRFRGNSDFGPDLFIDSVQVIATGASACPLPTNLSVTGVCDTAFVTWAGQDTALVQYGPAGFTPGTGTVVTAYNQAATITGLATGTAYDYWVANVCSGSGDTSGYAGPFTYTQPTGPTAAFTSSVNASTVNFNASTSVGAVSYAWTFGDGNSGTGVMPTHTYAASGSYSVTLTVTDACGNTASVTQTVVIATVATCPQPSGLNASNVQCDRATLGWASISGNSLVQWGPAGFTPGTGTVVNTISPYLLTGLSAGTSYDFWVADICSATGDTSAYTGPVTFTTATAPLPVLNSISWTQTATSATTGEVTFVTNASPAGVGYLWDFGNGTSSNSANPIATYTQNGSYSVTLQLSNACGTFDTTVTVNVTGISLAENALGAGVSVFPNPTNDRFSVGIAQGDAGTFRFTLTNALGQVIEQRELSHRGGSSEIEFDLSGKAKGIYLIRIDNGQASVTRRIHKN
ncbi:PKD domain-containing protein [bacterium]|nr:PKD domain-containing protein [bacterium]